MTSEATELIRVIGPLRRGLLRATRAAGGLADLPDAHVEVLRLLAVAGPSTSTTIAARLKLARPTVSKVVKAMAARGLLECAQVPGDRRSATIDVSAEMRRHLAHYDDVSAAVLDMVVEQLSEEECRILASATPVLRKVSDLLSNTTPPALPPEGAPHDLPTGT